MEQNKQLWQSEWIDYINFIPCANINIIVNTPYGIRRAIRDLISGQYIFTDCVHPMQNSHLSSYDILGWKFAKKEDLDAGRLLINRYEHMKKGEQILAHTLSSKNIFTLIVSYFKRK